jgi:hypothetical protein
MEQIYTEKIAASSKISRPFLNIEILTALWALSEAALGGVLHAFRVPFTGLFINSSAVLFMVLIAVNTQKKGSVLRATMIVLIVKGMVSPHTPLNAFIAVGFQGLLGEYLLRSKKYLLPAAIILGIITLLQSAVQKIVVLTIVYGNTLWESIDLFYNFVIRHLPFFTLESTEVNFSFWLIIVYIVLHVIAGISIGWVAAKVPGWISEEIKREKKIYKLDETVKIINLKVNRRKKSWLKKPSGMAVLLLAGILIIFSYIYPEISEKQAIQALIMIIRSVCIMVLWYIIMSPVLIKIYKRFLNSRKQTYAIEVQRTIQILPILRYIVYKTWNFSRSYSGFTRYKVFFLSSIVNILSAEYSSDENN